MTGCWCPKHRPEPTLVMVAPRLYRAREQLREAARAVCRSKARCATRWAAMKLLAKVTKRGQGPQRIYKCPVCPGWHLTSQVKPWWDVEEREAA